MAIKSKIAIATILSLAIAGCASEDTPQASNPTTPPVPSVASPAAKPPAAAQPQSFGHPVVPGKKATNVAFIAPATTLIQPTDGKTRIDLLVKGRPDPFAQIVSSPGSEVAMNTNAKQIPLLPPLPTPKIQKQKVPMAIAFAKKPIVKLVQTPKSVLPKVLPQVIPSSSFGSVLPPAPQPELAKAVMVTGVVLIGREPLAILKIPNEPSSRYVQAGQRLANGLLVKRIEMNEGSNPVVILEQYGIEVAKMVGEGSANSIPSETSSTNSVSVTTPPQNPLPVGAS
ncbi:hypothetical protein [Nostoc sp. FACHB-110]|uniref:hypothetical protein n=1 Tax=Nostoc sp. FACHB-110 TaxID=2692834 RepID=UPI00168868D8|nr:hypothetical protein [Nostoc sp. FACHB-110]MBD2437861.1 hypothetical protein [Nostoc sp. FACHB-110]